MTGPPRPGAPDRPVVRAEQVIVGGIGSGVFRGRFQGRRPRRGSRLPADIEALLPIFTPSSATTPNRAIPNFAHSIRTCSNTDSIAAAVSARNRAIVT